MFKTLLICAGTALLAACATNHPATAGAPDSRTANATCPEYATGSEGRSAHRSDGRGRCSQDAGSVHQRSPLNKRFGRT